jgi:hypothetical protein
MKKFIIENINDPDLLWSNFYGWTSGYFFDIFSFSEMSDFDLPIEGKWVELLD